MAANATFALKAGVWFRRVRLLIVSPDSTGTACPLSGRNSTYRPVQISGAGSVHRFDRGIGGALGLNWRGVFRPFCMAKSLEGRWLQATREAREAEPVDAPGRD